MKNRNKIFGVKCDDWSKHSEVSEDTGGLITIYFLQPVINQKVQTSLRRVTFKTQTGLNIYELERIYTFLFLPS